MTVLLTTVQRQWIQSISFSEPIPSFVALGNGLLFNGLSLSLDMALSARPHIELALFALESLIGILLPVNFLEVRARNVVEATILGQFGPRHGNHCRTDQCKAPLFFHEIVIVEDRFLS